jgi:hypothetical protein
MFRSLLYCQPQYRPLCHQSRNQEPFLYSQWGYSSRFCYCTECRAILEAPKIDLNKVRTELGGHPSCRIRWRGLDE